MRRETRRCSSSRVVGCVIINDVGAIVGGGVKDVIYNSFVLKREEINV